MVSRSELDAAGVQDPRLRVAYRRCRDLNARHGRTFFLATQLLSPAQRPPVHALYGFARRADDILDDLDPHLTPALRAIRLDLLAHQLTDTDPHGEWDPVIEAVRHTAHTHRIDGGLFEDFLHSMRMDLTVTDYPDRAALNEYVHGSAEVIGLQLLPVLGTLGPNQDAAPYAAALGTAFQLTNFLRDIAEDLDRGRVYLPADELAAFGVDRDLLTWCRTHRCTDPRVRAALAAQHHHTQGMYRQAREGIALLHPRSRPCVQTALILYSDILTRIEDSDFAVFTHRATVSTARRLHIGGTGLLQAWWARRPHPGTRRRPGPGTPTTGDLPSQPFGTRHVSGISDPS